MYQGEVHLDVKIDNPSTVKSARIDDEKLHKIEIEFLSGEASLIVDETNYGAIYFYGDQRPSGQVLMGKSDFSSKYQQVKSENFEILENQEKLNFDQKKL